MFVKNQALPVKIFVYLGIGLTPCGTTLSALVRDGEKVGSGEAEVFAHVSARDGSGCGFAA
ncbi:hypothetical protein GCM10029964_090260 [Kibdelosporangium lantanae]